MFKSKKDIDTGYAITEKLYEKNKDAKRGEYKKPISIAEIRSRKIEMIKIMILELLK